MKFHAKGVVAFLIFGSLASLIRAEFESTGLVRPLWEATLAPTVLGRVESIEVKESDRVEAGTLLLVLDKSSEELEAERRKIIADNRVEIELAQAKLELLQSEFESTKRIYESSGSISKEEFERTRLDLRLAGAELEQLKQRKKIELLDSRFAQQEVSKREIRAPQAGSIVEIFPEVGEVCEPRQPLIHMVDASKVRISLEVDALKTAGVLAGEEVPVVVEGPEGEITTHGIVDYVSPVVDGASGLRRIRITIDNKDGTILPGLSARVLFSNKK